MIKTKRIIVNCSYCKKKMDILLSRRKGRKHLFCSVQCYDDWQRKNTPMGEDNKDWNRVETRCAFCGKKLWKIPSRLEKYANQFCNRDCMTKWKKQNVFGDKNPNWSSKIILCDCCGKAVSIKKSKLDKDKHHFCDANCYLKWLKENPRMGKTNPNWNRVEMNCDFCGEKIHVTSHRLNLSKNHFCNKSCFDKWSRINKPRGRNSPTWNGGSVPFYGICWASQKRKILERAKYASEISGNNGGLLDIHHIIPMRNFIQKYIDLCLESIPSITLSSFKVLPYYLFIPDAIFEEANKESNLICVIRNEHPRIEGMPPTFFEAMRRKLNSVNCN